jgi:quercetin dioxygenase-like cupin family protein
MGAVKMSENEPTCENDALDLQGLAGRLLAQAHEHHSRRAASTILSGTSMRATVIALLADAELAEHEAPPAATLQILTGDVQLHAGNDSWPVTAGQVIAIPQRRHSLLARADAVVLLTVALH